MKINKKQKNNIKDFLYESNLIENEMRDVAMKDAIDAWDYLILQDKLTLTHVLKVHHILMRNIRPDIAGQVRDCPVMIGGEVKNFFNKEVLRSQIDDICKEINEICEINRASSKLKDKDGQCKRLHVVFEDIHPFEDGNGRVGRIIYNWHRVNMGLPIHVIHCGVEQIEYYGWFKK